MQCLVLAGRSGVDALVYTLYRRAHLLLSLSSIDCHLSLLSLVSCLQGGKQLLWRCRTGRRYKHPPIRAAVGKERHERVSSHSQAATALR